MKIGAFMPMKWGLTGAIERMHNYGGNCVMIYTGSPKSFYTSPVNTAEVARAEQLKEELGFRETIIHGPYIVNPANSLVDMQEKAYSRLLSEIKAAEAYKSKLLVIHPGSSLKAPALTGVQNLARVLNRLTKYKSDVTICVETMAGKGSEIMCHFEQFRTLFSLLEQPERVGVCFDTCHVHDAGYDLSPQNLQETLTCFDEAVGLDKIKVLHINGSLNLRGMHKDRHANIGTPQDLLGLEALHNFCHQEVFKNIPKILETPWNGDSNCYTQEIALLKE